MKTRARVLNDVKTYLKYISKIDSSFNFTKYYENTPFSDESLKIDNTTLKHSAKLFNIISKIII